MFIVHANVQMCRRHRVSEVQSCRSAAEVLQKCRGADKCAGVQMCRSAPGGTEVLRCRGAGGAQVHVHCACRCAEEVCRVMCRCAGEQMCRGGVQRCAEVQRCIGA
jgi:hypothetical protein